MTTSARALLGVTAACLAAGLLTSCASAPVVKPARIAVPSSPLPVLTTSQVDRIMEDVATHSRQADQGRTMAGHEVRFDGVALETRAVSYAVKAKFPDRALPPVATTDRLVDVIPQGDQWPHAFFSVTSTPQQKAPVLHVVSQQDARSPFKVQAWASLLPGANVPAVASAESGVIPANPDDKATAKYSAKEAVAWIADVLSKGQGTEHFGQFAESSFYKTVSEQQVKELGAATKDCEGCFNYVVNRTPREGALWTMTQHDGGQLVVGVLEATREFTVNKPGSKLPLDGELRAMSDLTEASNKLKLTALETIVLSIPPASSDAQITTIGGSQVLVKAEAS